MYTHMKFLVYTGNNSLKYFMHGIIMLSVIFSLYIHYTTILAYCTDIRVISLFHVYTVPRRGIEPGASWLQVRSATDWAMRALVNYCV